MHLMLCYSEEGKQHFVLFDRSYFANGFPNSRRETLSITKCHWWK